MMKKAMKHFACLLGLSVAITAAAPMMNVTAYALEDDGLVFAEDDIEVLSLEEDDNDPSFLQDADITPFADGFISEESDDAGEIEDIDDASSIPDVDKALESRTTGSGTKSDPWNYVFGESVSYGGGPNFENYYYFVPEADGVITVEGCTPSTEGAYLSVIDILSNDGNIILTEYMDNQSALAYFGKIGVKAGEKYLAYLHRGGFEYKFKLTFEKSDLYEAEYDSINSYKNMELNKEYKGSLSMTNDTSDFYHFSLTKKSKVNIYLSGKYTCKVTVYSSNTFDKDSELGYDWSNDGGKPVLSNDLPAGDYYMLIGSSDGNHNTYNIEVKGKASSSGGKEDPQTGEATINGEAVKTLKAAFKLINDPSMDYVIELKTDMIGEKDLTIPNKARSVVINGNGHVIEIAGSKVTSNAPLTLNNVTFRAKNKKGEKAKFTVNAKKDLTINDGVSSDALSTTFNVPSQLVVNGALAADVLKCNYLELNGKITVNPTCKVTVSKGLKGNNGTFELVDTPKNPIALNGTAEGRVFFNGSKQPDGTQLLKCSKKKISADALKSVFDVTGIRSNEINTYLYYFSGNKVMIFGEAIVYEGTGYGLWKDAVAQMNIDKKAGAKEFSIKLIADVNVKGPFKMPAKGYESLKINGNSHTVTFTGDITLTGNTEFTGLTLKKVNKKGESVPGKIKKGKYTYTGPEITQ
ncbi:MAG: hypothetical protein K6E63_05515 [Lachnospiraceae bacterium]|nr:hypothetical protein [Lachnospiraceae bacterium]